MAARDITIKIVGKRYAEGELEDQLEFVSDGRMFKRGDARYFIYEESEFSGFPGCKTSLRLTDGMLRMKRIGLDSTGYSTELIFEKGKRFIGRYDTPQGSFDMEVLTSDIKNNLSPEGLGKITLAYEISFHGVTEGHNEIDIEILQ